MKQIWLQGKEKARRLPEQPDQQNSAYDESNRLEEQVEHATGDAVVQTGETALHGGRKLAAIREQRDNLPARKAAGESRPHMPPFRPT